MKFNETASAIEANASGFPAMKRIDDKKELISIVINAMLKGDTFYKSESSIINDIILKTKNIIKEDEDFIMKLTVYTRTVMNLRSVSHLLAATVLQNVHYTGKKRIMLEQIMIRPDDAMEILALTNLWKMKIPNAFRRAVKNCLENKWDLYQFKKYECRKCKIKLADLVKLTHPNALLWAKNHNSDEKNVFQKIIENDLPAIDTAQTVNAGNVGEDRAKKYEKMLLEDKLGLMALLKNLKNILETTQNDVVVGQICRILSSRSKVLRSRVLPFRFVQAYQALTQIPNLNMFSKQLIEASLDMGFSSTGTNLEIVEPNDRVAIIMDESSSMTWEYNNGNRPFDIGIQMMASILTSLRKENTVGIFFGSRARIVDIDFKSPLSWIANQKAYGASTNFTSALHMLHASKTKVDKLIIFTDMQENECNRHDKNFRSMLNAYRNDINKNVKVLFWNLGSYGGSTPISENQGMLEVGGFSQNMLPVIGKIWKDKDALIKEIEGIKL